MAHGMSRYDRVVYIQVSLLNGSHIRVSDAGRAQGVDSWLVQGSAASHKIL